MSLQCLKCFIFYLYSFYGICLHCGSAQDMVCICERVRWWEKEEMQMTLNSSVLMSTVSIQRLLCVAEPQTVGRVSRRVFMSFLSLDVSKLWESSMACAGRVFTFPGRCAKTVPHHNGVYGSVFVIVYSGLRVCFWPNAYNSPRRRWRRGICGIVVHRVARPQAFTSVPSPNNACLISLTSWDTSQRWAQQRGGDESCLLLNSKSGRSGDPHVNTNTLNVNQGRVYRAVG